MSNIFSNGLPHCCVWKSATAALLLRFHRTSLTPSLPGNSSNLDNSRQICFIAQLKAPVNLVVVVASVLFSYTEYTLLTTVSHLPNYLSLLLFLFQSVFLCFIPDLFWCAVFDFCCHFSSIVVSPEFSSMLGQ